MSLDSPRDSTESGRRAQSLEEYAASLAASEELLELTHDAIIVRNIAGEIVFWNRGAEELYGWSRAQVQGKTTDQVLHTEFPEPLEKIIEQVKEKGRWDGELSQIRKDGTRLIVASRWALRYDTDGTPLGIVEMNDDITERRHIDQQLRTSQTHLAGIISSAMDAIISADENQNIIIFNAAAEKMFGWTAPEILGKPLTTLIPNDLRQPHIKHVIEFGRTGVSSRGLGHLGELRGLRRDGSEFPIEASISQVETDGSKIYSVVLRDITQRKRDERERSYYAELLRNISDAVFSTDAEYRVLSWNRGAELLYGWSAEEIIGKSINDLIRANKGEEENDEIIQAFLTTGQWHGEEVQRRKDGTLIDIQASSSVLLDRQGNPIAVVTVNRDITTRKRAEAAEHQQRILAQALSDTAAALNSTLDFETVLDKILENANKVVPHDAACIMLLEEGFARVVRSRGYAPASEAKIISIRLAVAKTPNLQEMVDTGQPVKIDDVKNYAGWQETAVFTQQRGALAAPIRNRGKIIGFITLDSFTPNKFSQTDAEHLLAFADQVSIAMENARLLGEAEERAQEFAGLYAMAHDFTLQSDLSALLQTVTARATQLLRVSSGVLWLYDAQRDDLEAAVTVNFPPLLGVRNKVGVGASGHVAATREPLIVNDYNASPYQGTVPAAPRFSSVVLVPLLSGGALMGVLVVGEPVNATREFTQADVQLLSLFAGPAAGAIHNAQLLERMKKRLEELQAVNKISSAVRAAQTLDEMLPLLLQETIDVFGANAGSIWLYDAPREELKLVVQRGWSDTPVTTVKSGEHIPGYVLATGVPYVRRDVKNDPLIADIARSYFAEGTNAAAVPIRASDQVIGVMFVTTPAGHVLADEDVRLFTTVAEIAGTAIQRTGLLEQTQQQLARLSALRAIDLAISGSLDLRITLNVVMEQALSQLHIDAAALFLLNPYTNMLEYAASRGFRTHEIERTHERLGDGYAGRAALEQQMVRVQNLADATPPFKRAALVAQEHFVSYCAVPLVIKGQVKGVLEIYHRTLLAPDDSWLAFLEALAGQAAIAIDSGELYSKLQRTNVELVAAYDTTLEGWSRALDLRDKETEGHTERVTELTTQLARAMGVPEAEIVHIRRGALLHDIGNMGIPDSILFKPKPLTDDEWAMIRRHPLYGYELLSQIAYLRPALSIPYAHHEKWDGTGYPRGLKGEEIPLAARIFAVVDVWDAMSSDRPYRNAWDKERIREHIQSLAGTHFDPAVVQAFFALDLQ